jgi:hypothetical protein
MYEHGNKKDTFHSISSYVSKYDAWFIWSMRRKSLAAEADSIKGEAQPIT